MSFIFLCDWKKNVITFPHLWKLYEMKISTSIKKILLEKSHIHYFSFQERLLFFFYSPPTTLLSMAHRILVPQPGIKPVFPAVEAQGLNHWTTRELPRCWYWLDKTTGSVPRYLRTFSGQFPRGDVCVNDPASQQGPLNGEHVTGLVTFSLT